MTEYAVLAKSNRVQAKILPRETPDVFCSEEGREGVDTAADGLLDRSLLRGLEEATTGFLHAAGFLQIVEN